MKAHKIKTIKEVAEEICPNPAWDLCGHKQRLARAGGDWLNQVTRVEKILEQFQKDVCQKHT